MAVMMPQPSRRASNSAKRVCRLATTFSTELPSSAVTNPYGVEVVRFWMA